MCVLDTGLCQNDDFTLAAHSAYKQVAYEVWATVLAGAAGAGSQITRRPPTRVTISATPISGADNPAHRARSDPRRRTRPPRRSIGEGR